MPDDLHSIINQYKPHYSDYTLESLSTAIQLILKEHDKLDAITLDHYMRPKTSAGLGYGVPCVYQIEEIYKTTHYSAKYKHKDLLFEIEQSQFKPLSRTKVISYDDKPLNEIPQNFLEEIIKSIDSVEDWGEAQIL